MRPVFPDLIQGQNKKDYKKRKLHANIPISTDLKGFNKIQRSH